MPATVTISAKGHVLRRIMRPQKLQRITDEALTGLADDAEIIFASFAPHRTGQEARNIHTVKDGKGLTVEVEARNPTTGYDYVGVTRFGTRSYHITPVGWRGTAAVIATGRKRQRLRSTSALRFVIGGMVLFRKSTKGYHPATDWVEDAMPTIKGAADRRLEKVAKQIKVEWSS
jgi:hypothetical protein